MKRIGILVAAVVALSGATAAWAATQGSPHSHSGPTSSQVGAGDDRSGPRTQGGSDDPAGHDAGDDRGGLRTPGGSDDPAGHDAGDDRGRGADDGTGHH